MRLFLFFFVLFSFAQAAQMKKEENQVNYNKEAIIQSILDLGKLQVYLHPEISGRIPLVISDHIIGQNLKLNKFKEKVKIVSDKSVTGAYLRFTVFECKADPTYCNIAFEYPIEGVSGSTGLWISPNGSYKFEKTDISER
jgi:hypothetical protein